MKKQRRLKDKSVAACLHGEYQISGVALVWTGLRDGEAVLGLLDI